MARFTNSAVVNQAFPPAASAEANPFMQTTPNLSLQDAMPPNARDIPESVRKMVQIWTDRIISARYHHEPAFERMREDMEFVFGIQHPMQEDLQDDRYVANVTMREINQSVASLYARNPKATVSVKKRISNTVWDGKQESAVEAAETVQSGNFDPMAMAIVTDYRNCQIEKQMQERVAESLEKEYEVQVDRQEPEFKLQMKQLVRRTKTTGVGFVKVDFKRSDLFDLDVDESQEPMDNRMKRMESLLEDYEAGHFDDSSSKMEELKMLSDSLAAQIHDPMEHCEYDERIVFSFPTSTSVIVDPACKILKGFVGARWIAQEYILPVNEVRAFFECPDLTTSSGIGSAKIYDSAGNDTPPVRTIAGNRTDDMDEDFVCVWEVYNKVDKTKFFICDGYYNYLHEPETPKPSIQRFWPIISITFNDTETEPGLRSSVYPPSDVRLMMSAQKEWNRSRQALKKHKVANDPLYFTRPGALDDADKAALKSHPPCAVIELKGAVDPGADLSKLVVPVPTVPITPELYEVASSQLDIQSTVGSQPEDLGASSRETATGETIREQARVTNTGSNVDDLDDLLTTMAEVAGEMMLKGMSVDTVKRDVGQGAAWPQTDEMRHFYCTRMCLKIEAASSGRPNKGLEIANYERLAPILMQLGANPMFLVREGVKRLDDRLDVAEAFPILPPSATNPGLAPMQGPGGPGGTPVSNGTQAGPAQPLPVPTDATKAGVQAGARNAQRPSPQTPTPPMSTLPMAGPPR